MSDSLFLQTLRTAQNGKAVSEFSFDNALEDFLQGKLTKETMNELIDECAWHETLMSPDKIVDNWKRLLSLNLLHHFCNSSNAKLSSKVYQFVRHPWNQSSQYFRVIVALNHFLAKLPVPEVAPHLLKGGAALIELQEYSPWLALPSIPHHLEFGIFLCALALLTQREDIKEKVVRLTEWQMNTLDSNFKPFSGLFIKEKDNEVQQNLILYYLLFKGTFCLTHDAQFESIAQKIQSQIPQGELPIDPLWILLEHLFKTEKTSASNQISLPEMIYDPSTALMGYRSNKQHAVCTLHGNKTGLGSFRYEDIEIVNYGPQYLPLGECQGFGIEGNALSDHGERTPVLQNMPQGFMLKGCTRMIDQPVNNSFFSTLYRGIWLEVTQEFRFPSFYLKTTLLGLDGWEGVAFSFFVKAGKCRIEKQELLPKSFDRYEGAVHDIILEGEKTRYILKSPDSQATMQIIPLAGGKDFWGADFLVAYLYHPEERHYEWQLVKEN
jgi:hypothetical protein